MPVSAKRTVWSLDPNSMLRVYGSPGYWSERHLDPARVCPRARRRAGALRSKRCCLLRHQRQGAGRHSTGICDQPAEAAAADAHLEPTKSNLSALRPAERSRRSPGGAVCVARARARSRRDSPARTAPPCPPAPCLLLCRSCCPRCRGRDRRQHTPRARDALSAQRHPRGNPARHPRCAIMWSSNEGKTRPSRPSEKGSEGLFEGKRCRRSNSATRARGRHEGVHQEHALLGAGARDNARSVAAVATVAAVAAVPAVAAVERRRHMPETACLVEPAPRAALNSSGEASSAGIRTHLPSTSRPPCRNQGHSREAGGSRRHRPRQLTGTACCRRRVTVR
jgi:hypothetical protein